jgi:hypothetical protein
LALKCLLVAAALDKEHSKVHEQTVRFKLAINKDKESLSPQAADIIKTEFTLLPTDVDLKSYNDEYLSRNKDCSRRTVSALKVRKLLSPEMSSTVEKDVVGILDLPSITMQDAKEAFALLTSWKSTEVESFRLLAEAKWPKASVFATA